MEWTVLANGRKMPNIGLGTWQATDENEVRNALRTALDCGYRHIDTAYLYQNEGIIGEVIREYIDSKKLKRKDLFITTKLWVTFMETEEHVRKGFNKSLESLGLDYIDLYLIHNPCGLKYVDDYNFKPSPIEDYYIDEEECILKTWKTMEKLVEEGHILSIGVSNFSIEQMKRILQISNHPIVCNQIENHVYLQQNDLVEFCHQEKIKIVAFAPIGSPARRRKKENWKSHVPLEDPIVQKIAIDHNKSPAQILLKFLLQRNVVVIPKSTNVGRIRENIDLNDFELSPEDISLLKSLDRNMRFFIFVGWEKHREYHWVD